MATIKTRASKGSALTNAEVDANFLNLNTELGQKVTPASSDTLTNKTVSLASNTLTGTLAQFNAALSDADFASLAGTETLTNKTLGEGTIDSTTTLVSQADIGTAPNQTPLNQYLGSMAFRDSVMAPVPDSATASGVPGNLAQDGSFLYICTAPNAWKRVALSSW